MTLGELERRLKRLNKNISVYRGLDDTRPAGIWIMVPTWEGGEYEEVCGIEKWNVKEFPTYTAQGKMLTGGWHRALGMLVGKGFVNRHESYKQFGHWDSHREPFIVFEQNLIDRAVKQLSPVAFKKAISPLDDKTEIEIPIYNTDDTVDIGRMIAKDNQRTSPPPSTGTGFTLGA